MIFFFTWNIYTKFQLKNNTGKINSGLKIMEREKRV